MAFSGSNHRFAFEKWFKRYEIERKKQHISTGRNVPGVPPAPPAPDEVHRIIFNSLNYLGVKLASELCQAHRTTVARWLDGSVQIPWPAYAMLKFHAEGVPPGCGDAWQGFYWSGDTLTCPDGKTRLSAQEIAGSGYQRQHSAALEARCEQLTKELIAMTRRVDWQSANDAFTDDQDVRRLAFIDLAG